ncbi:MAG: galactokinase [bacterium]|nr:galactokinase [bacterium]
MLSIAERALETFESHFGGEPEMLIQAPGRVNLIGEHTDYNDGFVFPAAIDRWVVFAVRARQDQVVRVFSLMHGESVEYTVSTEPKAQRHWSDYGKGVIREFQKLGYTLGGFDAVVVGNVPMGAGLSSSAAVEMAVGKVVMELNDIVMSGPDLALLGQRAENQFVGVNCGIMDQFISANGKAGHALFLDCRDLTYQRVPLPRQDVRIVICNTGVSRGLTDSAYNERRSACEAGVRHLGQLAQTEIRALRDVSMDLLDRCGGQLSSVIKRRCRHVISENERTQKAVALLSSGDLTAFGRLMGESHASLRDDYEVSGPELDTLVGLAQSLPGVLGARMTGAGFGGCTVNLVEEDALEGFKTEVGANYAAATGITPEIYVCQAVNGVERLS